MQNYTLLALAVAFGVQLSYAHMEMQYPAPLRSKFNALVSSGNADYSMTSPLTGPSQFPCKGYQSDLGTAAGGSTATFAAGSTNNFTITGGADHDGGSCQAALSYDGGESFTVIHSYIGNCPGAGTTSYDFTVPSDAASGAALFAWTWYNKVGNREIYQNCASITISGASSKVKRATTAFSARPDMFVANLDNGCTTIETTDLTFPEPGPDVTGTGTTVAGTLTGTCAAVNGIGSSAVVSSDTAAGSAAPVASSSPATSAGSGSESSLSATTLATQASSASSVAAPSIPGGVFATVATSGSTSSPTSIASSGSSGAASSAVVQPTVSASPGSASSAAPVVPVASSSPSSTPNLGTQSGPCTDEGQYNCIAGTSFQRCASGTWSVAMSIAAGTKCTAGMSDTLDIGFAKVRRARSVSEYF
ncbi:hypothetical protein BJ878DRAFT_219858 [Calycina marina]|uniref:Uncharacterized protein n=1 Tax=Calycina marina TaxID=1763456 RepID=A0A9P7Z899_9HELO|nr:hypothetical protein BJ878DRAFT_219858 [Calycina marina]